MSCVENTDVWDGGVPFIIGSPMALPNVFSVQAHAMRILWDKFPQIVDAVEPGGSGDMYAGLSVEEREALAEVTRMGFPPRAWFDVQADRPGLHGRVVGAREQHDQVRPGVLRGLLDRARLPRREPDRVAASQARVQHKTTVIKPIMADEAEELGLPLPMAIFRTEAMADIPVALQLDEASRRQPHGRHVVGDERQGRRPQLLDHHAPMATSS